MTTKQIIAAAIQYVYQRGIVTDETLLRRAQVLDLFCAARSKVLSDYAVNNQLAGSNYLSSVIDKEAYEQGGKFNYFLVAPAVMNKYEYVGGVDGCSRFRENITISQFQNTINQQVQKITLYYKDGDYLKVANNGVGTILTNYVPVNPTQLPTFNFDLDEFPVDDTLLPAIFEVMFMTFQSKVSQTPKDTVSDSQDTTKSLTK